MIRHGRIILDQLAVSAVGKTDIDVVNFPDVAVANEFARPLELRAGALHAAGLKHDAVPCHGIDDGAAFGQIMRKGLFAIDVFACVRGHDTGNGMPVIRRRDDHRVDVVARK